MKENFQMMLKAFLKVTLATVFAFILMGASQPGCEGFEESYRDPIGQNDYNTITNGTETDYLEWKGAIALYAEKGADVGNLCTGTFIDPEVILSAGHCIYSLPEKIDFRNEPSKLKILGGADLSDGSLIITYYDKVMEVALHPTWKGILKDVPQAVDLSLIRVSGLPDSPTPEIYKVRETLPSNNEEGILVGYGNSSTQGGVGVHTKGASHILGMMDGNTSYIELGNPSGTCRGDSGGPFFTMNAGLWQVTGVTSFGGKECFEKSNNWDVNVPKFRSWINEQVKKWTGHELGNIDEDTGDNPSDSNKKDNSHESCDCTIPSAFAHKNLFKTLII